MITSTFDTLGDMLLKRYTYDFIAKMNAMKLFPYLSYVPMELLCTKCIGTGCASCNGRYLEAIPWCEVT